METQVDILEEQLIKEIYKAALEYEKIEGKSFMFISKTLKGPFYWFECRFEAKHFAHLIAISPPNATDFYNKCWAYNHKNDKKNNDNNNDNDNEDIIGISISDCKPARNHIKKDIKIKVEKAVNILRIRDAKYMKIGTKDKINQYVDFTYSYGSSESTLGFKADKINQQPSSFPITLLTQGISEYTTNPQRITFVLEKKIEEETYSSLYMEIKKGLFEELYSEFPEELKKRVSHNLIPSDK